MEPHWKEEFDNRFPAILTHKMQSIKYGEATIFTSTGEFEDLTNSVKSFIESLLESERKELAEKVKGMNEQNNVTQAVLEALEYRGFYDAGKYLDGSIWERVQPLLLALLKTN